MPKPLTTELAVHLLSAIGETLNAGLGRQEMLQHILQNLVQELGYTAASVRLLNPERQTLEVQASVGLSQQYLTKVAVDVEHSQIDQAVLAGNRVAIENIQEDARWPNPVAARAEGIRSVLAIPLRIHGRYLGVLQLYTAEAHSFRPEEQQLLEAVGNVAARLIRNIRFYQALHTIAADVNSSLEVKKVLQALLRNVVEQINCKGSSIRLLGPRQRRLHLVATFGLSQQYLNKGEVVVQESPIDRQVLQGQVTMIADLQHETALLQYPDQALAEGIRSVLAVPLAVRGQMIGVMRVYSAQVHRFNDDEVEFLRTVADLGAVAIDTARLYEALSEKYEAAKEDWAGWYRFLALS